MDNASSRARYAREVALHEMTLIGSYTLTPRYKTGSLAPYVVRIESWQCAHCAVVASYPEGTAAEKLVCPIGAAQAYGSH